MTAGQTDPTSLPHTPRGYLQAWAGVESAWAATMKAVEALPAARRDQPVVGRWTFTQTLRHLVFATDSWLRRTVLGIATPYDPAGWPHDEAADCDGIDVSVWGIDVTADPSYIAVLALRADRMAQVRRVVEVLTPQELSRVCDPNAAPGNPEDTRRTVGHCLDVLIAEEWGHHGYVVRDLLG